MDGAGSADTSQVRTPGQREPAALGAPARALGLERNFQRGIQGMPRAPGPGCAPSWGLAPSAVQFLNKKNPKTPRKPDGMGDIKVQIERLAE